MRRLTDIAWLWTLWLTQGCPRAMPVVVKKGRLDIHACGCMVIRDWTIWTGNMTQPAVVNGPDLLVWEHLSRFVTPQWKEALHDHH